MIFNKVQEAKRLKLDLSAVYAVLSEEIGASISGIQQRYFKVNTMFKSGNWEPWVEGSDNVPLYVGQPLTPPVKPEPVLEGSDILLERIKFLEEQVAFYRAERDNFKDDRDLYREERDNYRTESQDYLRKILGHQALSKG